MQLYRGRNALVTGATSPIGKRLAEHLIKHGAKVICCDDSAEKGQANVKELNNIGENRFSPAAFFLKMDSTCWDSVEAAFDQARHLLSCKLDFVFVNAEASQSGFPDDHDVPITAVINVNVVGVVYTVQAAISCFRALKSGGRIVVSASLFGLYPFIQDPMYCASKHAVIGLVRGTAPRTTSEGIYINAVAPGFIDPTTSVQLPAESTSEDHDLTTNEDAVIEAFDLFLKPTCRLTGQVAEVIRDDIRLVYFPPAHRMTVMMMPLALLQFFLQTLSTYICAILFEPLR